MTLTDKSSSAGTAKVEFDISWDNSWYTTGDGGCSPVTYTHDCVWLFGKYRYSTDGGSTWSAWLHLAISESGTNPSSVSRGTGTAIDLVISTDCKGMIIRRTAPSDNSPTYGTIAVDDVQFTWDYDAAGLAETDQVEIRLFGIEMVYIPAADFYLGDRTARSGSTVGHFYDAADDTDTPAPATAGFISRPYVSNVADGSGTAGDIAWTAGATAAGALPGSRTQLASGYPRGTAHFYLMKYELTQKQYKDFLNTLTYDEQANRCSAVTVTHFMCDDDATTSPKKRNGITVRSGGSAGVPGEYACDLNDNNLFDEDGDGQHLACNWLLWQDVAAYADWAALRPATELEFERACRGAQPVVPAEYVWGTSAAPVEATALYWQGTSREAVTVPANANIAYSYPAGANWDEGPMRVGIFATASSGREKAGAGYYGNQDLGGNLTEWYVSIRSGLTGVATPVFAGSHGDGVLEAATGFEGNATNTDWPGWTTGEGVSGDNGAGVRGNAYNADDLEFSRTSWRAYASLGDTTDVPRTNALTMGARLARSGSSVS